MSTVNNRLLYASSTWAERATKYAIGRNFMTRAQRIAALRVTRANRTVSVKAVFFISRYSSGRPHCVRAEKGTGQANMTLKDQTPRLRCEKPRGTSSLLLGPTGGVSRINNAAWTSRILSDLERWLKRRPKTSRFM